MGRGKQARGLQAGAEQGSPANATKQDLNDESWYQFTDTSACGTGARMEQEVMHQAGACSTSTCSTGIRQVDRSKPVVFQVGHLGSTYWEWVDRPEQGTPRFFGPTLMEAVSKTPWWVVPLLWGPFFASCMESARTAYGLTAPLLLVWLAVGVVSWQLLEYIIHRCLFHSQPLTYWGITLHFLFHGCHHKYPSDRLRLVFPPVPAAVVIAVVYAVLHATLPARHAAPLFAGMGLGYVAYDCLHYACHHAGPRSLPGPLRSLRRRHMDHHFRDHSRGYGISSPLWDFVLRTAA